MDRAVKEMGTEGREVVLAGKEIGTGERETIRAVMRKGMGGGRETEGAVDDTGGRVISFGR